MTELIAHKVQIAVASERQRDQADHLVQRDGAVDYQRMVGLVHASVHFLIGQPEDQRFIAHQRLVVRFRVAGSPFPADGGW